MWDGPLCLEVSRIPPGSTAHSVHQLQRSMSPAFWASLNWISTTNPRLSCLITHTWFPFPLISVYMCLLFPIVHVDYCFMSVRLVSTCALLYRLACYHVSVNLLLRVSFHIFIRGLHLTLCLGYSPVLYIYMCLFWASSMSCSRCTLFWVEK
jgi:hypothetical protein